MLSFEDKIFSGTMETQGEVVNFVTALYSTHSSLQWWKKCRYPPRNMWVICHKTIKCGMFLMLHGV